MKLRRRLFKTKIGRRLVLVFLGLSVLPLAALGWIAMRRAEAEIHRQTLAVLHAATDGAEAQLREFIGFLKARMLGLSLDSLLRDSLETLTSAGAPGASVAHAASDLHMSLAQRKERFSESEEIFAMDLRGRIIGSSSPQAIGADYSQSEFFIHGQQAVFVSDVFRDPVTGQITWIIASPIRSRSTDQLIGVLADRINPRQLSDVTTGRRIARMGADTQSFRIGETGETYIVNRNRLLITESRFIEDAMLKVKVNSEPVRLGLDQGKEMTGDYQDYRGRRVSGASTLIPETGWVMVTEIDFGQAFAPLRRLQRVLLPVTLCLAFALTFAAWRFITSIVKPLEALNEAESALIENQPLNRSEIFVPESNIPSDEIGEVIRRRNQRVQALLDQQEQLAAEQTHRAELLGRMLQETLTFSRTFFWRMPLPETVQPAEMFWSPAETYGSVEDVLGYPPAAFQKNLEFYRSHTHPDDLRNVQQLVGSLRTEGSAIRAICRFRHAKGQWVWIHLQVSVVRSEKNGTLILQGIGTEVTEMMQSQAQLQQTQEQLRSYAVTLEHEVAQRTAKLQETIRSLEGVCYHLVHDLRAPLRAMQGFSTLLLEEYGPRLEATGENYAQRISESAARMDRLITDLLEFGRIGHMPLATTEVSVEQIIECVRIELARTIRVSRASIAVQPHLPHVLANATALHKVFRHLLSNSLSFVAPGVIPHIRIWAEEISDYVRIFVSDNGIGIPEEYRDRIFGIFERLHSEDSYPGTGIGLAIVSKAIERMDGRVGFKSEQGSGSTFWVDLRRVEPGRSAAG